MNDNNRGQVMIKEEDDYKNEDDTPALSLSLGEKLKLDQSILQNVNIEPPIDRRKQWEVGNRPNIELC